MIPNRVASGPPVGPSPLVTGCVLCGGLLGAYWTTLGELARRWSSDPQYSHGYLVPAFALALLWFRREKLDGASLKYSWWGVPLLMLGTTLRLAGTYFYFNWPDAVSLLPCLAGIAVLLGGWSALRWSWPAIGFLFFMIPLPSPVGVALSLPLQRMAAEAGTYALQTLGFPALSEGNVIVLSEAKKIDIVEACSGLRMLISFFALSTAVALLLHRPLWERALVLLSAVPIALVSNLTRIVVTGIILEWSQSELVHRVFHDWAGWLMMPLGLGMLWLELQILNHLLVTPEQSSPLLIDRGLQSRVQAVSGGTARKTGGPDRKDTHVITKH